MTCSYRVLHSLCCWIVPPVRFMSSKTWPFFGSRGGRLARSSEGPFGLRSFLSLVAQSALSLISVPRVCSLDSVTLLYFLQVMECWLILLVADIPFPSSCIPPWWEVFIDRLVLGVSFGAKGACTGGWCIFKRLCSNPFSFTACVQIGGDDYKSVTYRELATLETTWRFPASEAIRRTSPNHGHRWRMRTVPGFPNDSKMSYRNVSGLVGWRRWLCLCFDLGIFLSGL